MQDTLALYQARRNSKGILRKLFEWIIVKQPSWFVSLCLHATMLVILGLLVLPITIREQVTLELGSLEADLSLDETVFAPMDVGELNLGEPEVPTRVLEPVAEFELSNLIDIGSIETLPPLMHGEVQSDKVLAPGIPGGIAGRGGRRKNAVGLGASKGSEEAVDRALEWLAAHQNYDGSWTFDLGDSPCRGACRHAGSGGLAKNAATALALLPFLGAGHTQDSAQYRHNVSSGLLYLMNRQRRNGSLNEPQGTMYSHGLASLALCEAVAMTDNDRYSSEDRKLRMAAQQAIDFIVQSQHQQGGWRYEPGQRGDTSVVGCQAMALQSGKLAGLRVPAETFAAVNRFLDSVSSDNYGATYGYQSPAPRPGTTAIGLLCRMYLGWDKTHPGIANGAEHLSQMGPSSNNVYFDYYATQVMHHYQGPLWPRWNSILRDHLVQTQEKQGHESGSWYFEGDFGSGIGGRLYITAMSAMILEVYYRHMPIYSHDAVAMFD